MSETSSIIEINSFFNSGGTVPAAVCFLTDYNKYNIKKFQFVMLSA